MSEEAQEEIIVYPIAMTKRGGILGNRSSKYPIYLTEKIEDFIEVAELDDTPENENGYKMVKHPCVTFYVNSESRKQQLCGAC